MAKGESGLVNAIAEAFIAACRDEIEAPEARNVHVSPMPRHDRE